MSAERKARPLKRALTPEERAERERRQRYWEQYWRQARVMREELAKYKDDPVIDVDFSD